MYKFAESDHPVSILNGLPRYDPIENDGTGDPCYLKTELLRPGVQEIELAEDWNCWIYVKEDDCWVDFAVMEFTCGVDDQEYLTCVWAGSGAAGSLRELRHSWFGDNGYVFYLNMDTICAACEVLRRYFDAQ